MNNYLVLLKIDGVIVEEAEELLSGARLEEYDRANRGFAEAYARDEVGQLVELDWHLLPRRCHA